MLVGVAVVAAAMYVAASPASQQAKGPTAKQFNALKKQVAGLNKTVKGLKTEANALAGLLALCYFTVSGSTAKANGLPVSQFGNSTSGFVFGPPNTNTGQVARTALDVAPAGTQQEYLQEVNSTCVTGGALKHLLPKHAH
jgi:hypothetical protein